MDRSLDSIGSCSLDVDADSSDISDTSGSLNFPTPISVKDITREFTANIRERCTLRSPLQPQPQRTTTASRAYVTVVGAGGGGGGVRMVLSPPSAIDATAVDDAVDEREREKKPSYLNLACCVNGYSNLTTYDSKIRQDINKSREVSPIRPSTSSLQYCKRNNSLAAPVLHSMPLTKQPLTATPTATAAHKYETNNNNNGSGNGVLQNGDHLYSNGDAAGDKSNGSFIQQRVERLYGPGALAQVFYSPKKHSQSPVPGSRQKKQFQQPELDVTSQVSELSRKFKQLSPSKNYGEFHKKLQLSNASARSPLEQTTSVHNGDVDLPVFRHLSHEFRAQLPTVSPKRSVPRVSPAPEVPLPLPVPLPVVLPQSQAQINGTKLHATGEDIVDHVAVPQIPIEQLGSEEYISTTKISSISSAASMPSETASDAPLVKDGNYFLKILKDEQVRLLALAAVAEKYTDALTNNPDISEDTFGLLRSASGKARLLVSQKMKQFEGLCHNNLNRSPEDAFPTTIDDLQGFWDMVYLQVTHVDTIFAGIEELKRNDWQRVIEEPKASDTPPTKSIKTPKTGLKPKSTTAASNSKPAASNSVAAMKREAQRKQLLEMKRQRREALAAASASGSGSASASEAAAGENNQSVGDAELQVQVALGDTVVNAVSNSS